MPEFWPALQSCRNKHHKSSREEGNDWLRELPDDILFSIVSFLTMKDVARLSLVSRRLEYVWRCFPSLKFEDLRAMERIKECEMVIPQERSTFVTWVSRVLDRHLGSTIDELSVTFDLDGSCQSHVDKWVVFALGRQVRRFELDFTSWYRNRAPEMNRCTLPLESRMTHHLPQTVASIKSSLASLCLKYVNFTDEFVDCLLRSCQLLENLCIVGSAYLTKVKVSGPLQRVKHLEVSHCSRLKIVDISAPCLLSFTHYGHPIELHLRHSSSLSKVTAGERDYNYPIAYVFDSLLEYFSQLEYLSLMINLYCESNLQINNYPALKNLKHLELCVIARFSHSLLGWTSLIVASPVLQKLTLKLSGREIKRSRPIRKCNGCPLKCLKTLEIYGFTGRPIDLELAAFVFENVIVLEEVIVDFTPLFFTKPYYPGVQERLVELERMLPRGVKLTVK